MTDHELQCIFIHFPRTAGSSVEKFLKKSDDIYGYKESEYMDTNNHLKTIKEQHHTSADKYISQNGQEIWDRYFTFSFVRNPWDWFVSNFFWDIYQYDWHAKRKLPIKYRRKFIVEECDRDFQTYLKRGAQRPDWFKFTQAKDFIGNVEFVGKYENLNDDMKHVCERLGIKYTSLAHENKTNRTKYTDYYDKESTEIVYNLFKTDIRHFGYEYGQ
tara:strand:- start:7057 stop:7701 length:645 start_codon:yes stop_codon:yes gene_type:complete